nr:exocyst complex component EXO70B1-like [Tanacetum cinerariifolium]
MDKVAAMFESRRIKCKREGHEASAKRNVQEFSQVFTPGRKAEKYIKYQPEDIETCIEELFDGTTSQQSKKR